MRLLTLVALAAIWLLALSVSPAQNKIIYDGTMSEPVLRAKRDSNSSIPYLKTQGRIALAKKSGTWVAGGLTTGAVGTLRYELVK